MINKITTPPGEYKTPKKTMVALVNAGFVNAKGVPYSWAYMSKFLRDGIISKKEAEAIVLLELNRTDGVAPRLDLIERFVRYVHRADIKEIKEILQVIKTRIKNK
jgi:hypothetical protein